MKSVGTLTNLVVTSSILKSVGTPTNLICKFNFEICGNSHKSDLQV
ncbi:hypothetical protein LEP1GSC084_3431 [Leptospira interrogans serovar Medanensis str. L0448]|nr:hypothetical protein LEP1GSC084_3431 [Leptospira interrogans serovar Medanensis str. L0448]